MREGLKEVHFDKYCSTCAYKNVSDEAWPCSECLDHECNLHSHKPINYVDKKGNEPAEKPRLLDPIPKRITENGTYRAKEEGSIGYSTVDVVVPIPNGYIKPNGTLAIAENGEHDCTKYEKANVNVQPTLQSKTVTPTMSEQNIVPDEDFDGLNNVIVEAMPFATTEEVEKKFEGAAHILPVLQTKKVTPGMVEQYITADDNFYGLDMVIVEAIPFATTKEVEMKFGG